VAAYNGGGQNANIYAEIVLKVQTLTLLETGQ
jgi:hypothetical protein